MNKGKDICRLLITNFQQDFEKSVVNMGKRPAAVWQEKIFESSIKKYTIFFENKLRLIV